MFSRRFAHWADAPQRQQTRPVHLRKSAQCNDLQGCKLGEKIPPNYFYRFMCLRIVSALLPLAMAILAMC